MAINRAITRVVARCVQTRHCANDDPVIQNATRLLIKIPEHTWGLPSIFADGVVDTMNWRNDLFNRARRSGGLVAAYTDCKEGWREQVIFWLFFELLVDLNHLWRSFRGYLMSTL